MIRSEASTTGSKRHSLQHVLLTFSQVSKENWQSVQNLRTMAFNTESIADLPRPCFLSYANK